jgi:hypothetical protein
MWQFIKKIDFFKKSLNFWQKILKFHTVHPPKAAHCTPHYVSKMPTFTCHPKGKSDFPWLVDLEQTWTRWLIIKSWRCTNLLISNPHSSSHKHKQHSQPWENRCCCACTLNGVYIVMYNWVSVKNCRNNLLKIFGQKLDFSIGDDKQGMLRGSLWWIDSTNNFCIN